MVIIKNELQWQKLNRNVQQTFTGIADVFFPFYSFLYDTAHPNELGCKIWSEYISSVFYDVI